VNAAFRRSIPLVGVGRVGAAPVRVDIELPLAVESLAEHVEYRVQVVGERFGSVDDEPSELLGAHRGQFGVGVA
jgi:hypothetical protein